MYGGFTSRVTSQNVSELMSVKSWPKNRNPSRLPREQLQRNCNAWTRQEENLLDLAATGELAVAKVKARLGKIQQIASLATRRLENTHTRATSRILT